MQENHCHYRGEVAGLTDVDNCGFSWNLKQASNITVSVNEEEKIERKVIRINTTK